MFLPLDISRPVSHLRNRQKHDHETNQFFFLLDHRWLSYHGRNGALKRQRCWPSRAGIYSRLCLAGYAKNPGKSWFVKGLWWSCTDFPSTLSTSLGNRYWIPISLLSWRCGLVGTNPTPIAPPQQNRQFRRLNPYVRCFRYTGVYAYCESVRWIWILAKFLFCVFLNVKKGRGQYPISISIATLTEHVREGRVILFALVANENIWFTTSFQLKELFIW